MHERKLIEYLQVVYAPRQSSYSFYTVVFLLISIRFSCGRQSDFCAVLPGIRAVFWAGFGFGVGLCQRPNGKPAFCTERNLKSGRKANLFDGRKKNETELSKYSNKMFVKIIN